MRGSAPRPARGSGGGGLGLPASQGSPHEDAREGHECQAEDRLGDGGQPLLQLCEQDRQAGTDRDLEPGPAGHRAGAASGSSESSAGGGFTGGSRAALAVQYALSQVGDPYSYSANPPDSWDCSKLTSAAWAQAGVGLTALSYTQWDQTRRVPVSEIQPGDLVFYFGSGAHHVAIYVGNGKMVSASNPGDGVELIDFLGPWYKERFSGVGRVLG